MHTTSPLVPDAGAGDAGVDELVDAVGALVRAWRHAGRQLPDRTTTALVQLAGQLRDGEHRLGEIACRRGVDQSVVSRQVGELEARGLVRRRPDPADRRAQHVGLTPAGRELLDRAALLTREIVRGALARRPDADVAAVAAFVADLAAECDSRAGALLPPTDPAEGPS